MVGRNWRRSDRVRHLAQGIEPIPLLYVNTLRDKQGGGSLFKLPRRSLGKSLLFFAAVVFGQRIKKFCIRGHSRRQQLVVLADRGHVLSRAFRFSI